MFLLVHRPRDGWLPPCPSVHYASEDEAQIDIPVLAELLGRPRSTFRVVPEHIAARQVVPLHS